MRSFFDWHTTKRKNKLDYADLDLRQLETKDDENRSKLLKNYEFTKIRATLKYLRGMTGLRNLGNTCYMNSALQCLSHTLPLTQYLLKEDWIDTINSVSNTGPRGGIVCSYAHLLRLLWNAEPYGYAVPKKFKKILGKENHHFEGFEQNDAQEFLAFLIDCLHEDLNLVIRKPYIELRGFLPSSGGTIAQYGEECHLNFKKRNRSVITALFYGQFRSVIVCPDCNHRSIKFDPFNMVSLPLNSSSMITINIIHKYCMFKISQIHFQPSKKGVTLGELKAMLSGKFPDISQYRFYRFLKGNSGYMKRMEEDDNADYESIYRENEMMPFLVYDQFFENVQEEVPILMRMDHYAYCRYITKPVICNKIMKISKLYQKVYEMCQKTTKKTEINQTPFEKMFGKVKNEWPFHLIYRGIELTDLSNDSVISLENYENLVIKLNSDALTSNENLGDHLSFISEDLVENTLADCLDNFTKNEKLDEFNTWYCSKCQDQKRANKELKLSRLPNTLIIHLKRFQRDNGAFNKNLSIVNFPNNNFNLDKYIVDDRDSFTGPTNYELYGVINHFGTMNSGHYTAYVKSPALQKGEEWVEFNDTQATPIGSGKLVSSASYVLFYRAQNQDLELKPHTS